MRRMPIELIDQGKGYAAAYTLLVAWDPEHNAMAGQVFGSSATGTPSLKRNACGAIVNFVNDRAKNDPDGPLMLTEDRNIVINPNIRELASATFLTILSS